MGNATSYTVIFKNDVTKISELRLTVSIAITPENAAEEFETIVECAYGVAAVKFPDTDMNDYTATSITHDGEMIIDFTA